MSHTIRKYPANPSFAISASSCSTCFFARSCRSWFIRPIAQAHALIHALAQKTVHRLALGDGIMRKLITQIVQLERQPLRNLLRRFHRPWNIAKQRRHLRRPAQVEMIVPRQKPPRMVQVHMVPDRREHVQNLAIPRLRIPHAVGRHHRQPQRARNPQRCLVARFLLALLMPLQFDIRRSPAQTAASAPPPPRAPRLPRPAPTPPPADLPRHPSDKSARRHTAPDRRASPLLRPSSSPAF